MEDQFKSTYQTIATHFDFGEHPYFLWMSMASREEFATSQSSFVYAVEEFPCALAACLAKLGSLESRSELAGNIAVEHGCGTLTETHKHTFLAYLSALGLSGAELANIPYPVGVRAFAENVRNFCLAHLAEEGAALLGMIEYAYSGVSALIASHIHERRWVEPGAQRHYATHAELDIEHSEELFRIARREWESPSLRPKIEKALELGAYMLWEVYASMLPVRAQSDFNRSSEKRRGWTGVPQTLTLLRG